MEIGVAYYPEHWPESRWDDDFALMAKAGITLVRMAEFAWCRLEPREGQFEFGWLDRAVGLAARHGIRSVLCTPTEAPPPWLSVNYPETRPWTPQGQPYAIGSRRNCDPASPAFVHFSDEITRAMGRHYGRNPHVAGWQLDNEVGAHTHFVSTSPWMAAKFRDWLRRKYGTVEALNEAWGLVFWSGEVREWSEVEVQTRSPAGANPAYEKELRDFGQQLWLDFLERQAGILRHLCPGQFITHNFAWYGEQIDLWRLHEFLDIVGIDHYSRDAKGLTAVADLYHAAGCGKPWAVLEMGAQDGTYRTSESAGPATGWLTAALVKHALAGAKFASMFRFMCSPAGSEQFGGVGLRDEWGRPSTTVESTSRARRIIDKLKSVLARPRFADVAIVCDTDDLIFHEMWPVMGGRRIMCNDYVGELFEIHRQLAKRGHRPTFASLAHDLSRFRAVFVWNKLMIRQEQAEALRRYVEQGGAVISGYCLGFLNHAGRRNIAPLPYGLTDVFGCTVRDTLHIEPGSAPRIDMGGQLIEAAKHGATLEGLGGATLAKWKGWTGAFADAIVANRFGRGQAIYIGALLDAAGWETLMPMVMRQVGLSISNPFASHPSLETFPERGCWVAVNTGHEPLSVSVAGRFRDLVADSTVEATLNLPPYAIAVLE